MRGMLRIIAALVAATMLAACASAQPLRTALGGDPPRVLIFSKSTGYRHASIEPGIAMIREIGAREGWIVDATEDPDIFSPDRLEPYDAIVLISTTSRRSDPTSEWFVDARRTALQDFVHRGGGIVGIHAAADSHYNWPWYRQMIGANFERHPPGEPPGAVTIVDDHHPSTKGLPTTITRSDEWYYYVDFDPTVNLLAVYDPASIGQPDVNPNPISWSHEFEGGRIFYTGLGHTPESYGEEYFQRHITGGLRWALRLET